MNIIHDEKITWIKFDVKRKMKRTFTEAKLEKYIFGEEYKERPKEHKKVLHYIIRNAKKTIAEKTAQRVIKEAGGETDTVYLDHIYGTGFYWQQLTDAEEKLATGNYLQTAEDFAYHKEWMARWTYFEATCRNATRDKANRILYWDDEYRFKTWGYDWDKHTGVLDYDNVPNVYDRKQMTEFRHSWG
jgi:hypothetical protein